MMEASPTVHTGLVAELLNYLSGLLSLIIGWLWTRIHDIEQRLIHVPDRSEVNGQLTTALEPVKDLLTETRGDIKTLILIQLKRTTNTNND